MIRHVVLVRYRAEVTQAEKTGIVADLARLMDHLPGMTGIEAGPNLSPEGLGRGYDDGFIVSFTDFDARDAYLADDTHRRIGARLVSLAEGGLDGLLVFDLDV